MTLLGVPSEPWIAEPEPVYAASAAMQKRVPLKRNKYQQPESSPPSGNTRPCGVERDARNFESAA